MSWSRSCVTQISATGWGFDPHMLELIPAIFVWVAPFVLLWIVAGAVIKVFAPKK